MRTVARVIGTDRASVFGSVMIGLGLLVLAYAAGMHADLVPGSRVTLPRPPALDRPRASAARQEVAEPPALSAPTAVPAPPVAPTAVVREPTIPPPAAASVARPEPASPPVAPPSADVAGAVPVAAAPDAAVPLVGRDALTERPDPAVYGRPMLPADAPERLYRNRPPPGRAVHLRIPALGLETEVRSGGVVANADGELEWETLPFVAAHYDRDTSLVGARGNAVISGHVVTRFEGNVFRDLYRVDIGDAVETETEQGRFVYTVRDLKLVPPTAVDVLAATREPILTLVTCAGEFNPATRQFSERLVVVAELSDWARHPSG